MAKKQSIIFMSGVGSNAEALLDFSINHKEAVFEVAALFSDRPDQSRTYEIAEKYNLEVLSLDIFKFYQNYGEEVINLATPRRVEIRDLWTREVSKILKNFGKKIDFLLLAGFEPLSNITEEYVSMNVHPGDLTFEINGERVLNGLGVKPIELAISLGHKTLRSSVIIAQSFNGKNSDIDAGPILGISEAMPIDFCGFEADYLQKMYQNRPQKLPKGFVDDLRVVARKNVENLKYAGDHVVFPRAVNDYAAGKFQVNDNGDLFYFENGQFIPIKTIEYRKDGSYKLIVK